MPNRILHESIKYCPKMEQLNWFEEVVYHRLTVTVDDYGCLDGRIVLLKNTLFPTREDISKDDIARAIEHMVALGLLRAYEAGGMPYLCFPAWEEEQRVRNKRRKFPAPPDAARDEEEPLAAEDSLSAADGGALFAGEKHLTASCCQLTAGCPPESNPYPNPYPYPDSNPKFESGSVTNPYPIQAPGACAEERPRAGEQSLRHSLRCDTVPQFSMGASLRSQSSLERLPASLGLLRPASATGGGLRAPLFAKREAIDGAIPEDGVRPLAGESPRPASALPSEGAREAPREEGQSLRCGCAAPKGSPWHQGELSAKPTEGMTFTQEQLLSGAIPENSACSSVGVPGIEKPPANASKEEYHAYLVRLQEHFAREDAAAAAEKARQAANAPQSTIPAFVWETVERLRAQAAARRARERAESEARYRKALATWFGDTSAEKAECCAQLQNASA
ncbi:MAG TPA: hypothetical protein IAA64_00005 [Candidatus Ornithocaccomicrobium faecavium]|uniref:Uncharacterized protein n=2 Tax=Candidatus Ornithocaccomicrobium faecavium TaxID=2840890 RepID=A0A9D1P4E8_9FIRM|nr:hypothetical protein [Candidatus Ornithocaccomicrobium faecavium]